MRASRATSCWCTPTTSPPGLGDGDLVKVPSRVGTVTIEVPATDDVMPGVVSLPHG